MSDIAGTYTKFAASSNSGVTGYVVAPMMNLFSKAVGLLPPETAQRITVRLWELASNAEPLFLQPNHASLFFPKRTDNPRLRVHALGKVFPNPIGQAAGLDKNARIRDGVLDVGFGFGEVGTITPKPQKGNEGKRLFRLKKDLAVINRMGFNNDGIQTVSERLANRRAHRGILGVNIGANKDSSDRIADYVTCLRELSQYVDYVTINVSSPNTPGLRGLQNRTELENLLKALIAERQRLNSRIPLLLKIAPDLDLAALREIAEVAEAPDTKIDGLIVSNTTVARGNLKSATALKEGGLSGKPLFSASTQVLKEMRKLVGNRVLLIGVGGISSGADAYEKIRAGASLLQLYTALIYQGPGLIDRIKEELLELLARDGFSNVSEAVGVDVN